MPETAFAIHIWTRCHGRCDQKLRLIREGCASGIQEWLPFHVNAGTVPLASQILYALLSQLFRNNFGGVPVASRSTHDRDQCAVASVDNPRTPTRVQIQTIELVFGED